LAEPYLLMPLALAVSLLLSHLTGQLFPDFYQSLMLQPRQPKLWQIATFAWVHGGYQHLLLNVLPLLLLTGIILLVAPQSFWLVSTVILLVGGWGTWLCSTASRVGGASGLVFGYWAYIIATAAISGKPEWTAAAAITLLFYSGLWASLGEVVRGVSWSAHFWGLSGGVVAAALVWWQ